MAHLLTIPKLKEPWLWLALFNSVLPKQMPQQSPMFCRRAGSGGWGGHRNPKLLDQVLNCFWNTAVNFQCCLSIEIARHSAHDDISKGSAILVFQTGLRVLRQFVGHYQRH